jgi:5-dehydro-4-deoxyglucarate dehydratase
VQLTGLLSFPLTPFGADGELDLGAFADHVRHQLAAGPGALFVACGTGEGPALSAREHAAVVGTATRVAAGAVPVLAGVGGSAAGARELAAAAREAGADGLLLLPPYLVEAPEEGLVRYAAHVAAGAGLPTIVYRRANARYGPAAARQLLDVPGVVGLKDGVGDLAAVREVVTAVRTADHPAAGTFLFLNGVATAEVAVAGYRDAGVPLYSSAVHCFAPDLAHAFHRAAEAGDDRTTGVLLEEFYLPLTRLRDEVPGYAVALVKAAARLGGQRVGGVRPPLVDPHPEHLDRLTELLAAGAAALRRLRPPARP